jgi:hypothetical protein
VSTEYISECKVLFQLSVFKAFSPKLSKRLAPFDKVITRHLPPCVSIKWLYTSELGEVISELEVEL